MTRGIRVIKLGGSLLSRPNWHGDFLSWHEKSPSPALDVLIVGGGQPVNLLRKLADRVGMDDSTAHWVAIEFMSANARLVADRLGYPIVESFDDLNEIASQQEQSDGRLKPVHQLLDPTPVLQNGRISLEESWRVTSDSIAAAVAADCNAQELVLLKSTPPPTDDVEKLARIGYVDEYFPTASAGVKQISFVDP